MARPCPLLAFCGLFLFFFFLPCLSCPEHQKQALLQYKSSILAIISSFSSKQAPLQYKSSLLAIISSFSSSNSLLQSWNSNSSCCRWDGVECSLTPNSTSGPVIGLHLMYPFTKPLVPSTILAPIFHIRSLEGLYMSDNNIQGEIPAVGFANLSNLVHLDLSWNNFSGSVPPQLFHLPLLQYLFLDDNSLSGKVPEGIGNLSRLQLLSLLGNRFSDGVLLSVLSLKGLEFLDCSDNDLSTEIPTEIGNLPNISTLALSNNRLTGGIPSSMQKLSKLENLYLHN